MKKIFVLLSILFFLSLSVKAQSTNFVRVERNELRDENNRRLRLDSVNLGNWLLWEGWMSGGGFAKESLIKERLRVLLGAADYKNFVERYYGNYITERDIREIAANGFNSVRVPFNYRLFEPGAEVDGFRLFDNLIVWGKRYKVYLILDMHSAPGGQSPFFIADPSGISLWDSPGNRRKTLDIWKNIASRYRNEKIIAGYDLLNEPKAKNQTQLIEFYREIIAAIRSVDSNHLLIVEGNDAAKDFRGFPAKMDDNQIYSYHFYAWFTERNKRGGLQKISRTINSPLPVWCGEWGEDTPENLREVLAAMREFPNDAGAAFWTWKRAETNNARKPFYSIEIGDDWQKVVNWATNRRLFKPSREEIRRGSEQFLRDIEIGSAAYNQNTRDSSR